MSNTAQPKSEREHVHAYWAGPSLSPYEHLSLKSFLAAGARVSLYSYDKKLAVPEGVDLVDANEILAPSNYTLTHANGDRSLVPPSNLFRYAAIRKLGGWYADTDMICLGGSLPNEETFLVREANWSINAAIMKFPARHPVVEALFQECERVQSGLEEGSIRESWGVLGPALVTRVINSMECNRIVFPKMRAYEIGYDEVLELFNPDSCEELIERTRQSDFTHLWNEVWRSLKIPKLFGPPAGSFLDTLFCRFGVEVSPEARLSYEAVSELFRERQLIADVKYNLRTERLPPNATEKFIRWANGTEQVSDAEQKPVKNPKTHRIAERPQLIQTFWNGETASPFQLLCLRSFVDYGHQVEVFTYHENLKHPEWLIWSDASQILPRDKVLIRSSNSQLAIHSNLFRYSLLHQRGGWWIDPDIFLVNPDLPNREIFHAGPGDFELISPAALKFPKRHPVVEAALHQTIAAADLFPGHDESGAPLLTQIIRRDRSLEEIFALPPLSQLSWFSIAELFDPGRASELERGLQDSQFLHLHMDAWARAGIPQGFGPPEGSFLDRLFGMHDTGVVFPVRTEFGDVRRWIVHLYEAMQNQR